ncbi:TCP-1/cpn60 chaperonin family protein [Streptomyces sp. NPDC086023]|uniref:caspase, EACC1-associated type n=1 Tax=Streptomyces sp. NPDC086023 TaxID=3365746 RepID=UPI0037D81D69
MAVRDALVIATSTYEDARLKPLTAPGRDADALAGVLADPSIGNYAVQTVLDEPAHVVGGAIEKFFAARKADDQLLLYLSCHGIKNSKLELYFAARNTDKDLLKTSSLPATVLNDLLNGCRARRILVLLDCCYSGAFRPGAKGDTTVHLREQFRAPDGPLVPRESDGTGIVVITATDELQQAWEEDAEQATQTGRGQLSVFTRAVVEGLASGRADQDGDGEVSAEDLYNHVLDEMLEAEAPQTPLRWVLGGKGTLKIARRADGTAPTASRSPRPMGGTVGAELYAGIERTALALHRTYGPNGRPFVLPGEDGPAFRSQVTAEVVARLAPPSGYQALGHGLVTSLVERMEREVGDGTAGAILVFDAFVRALLADLAEGAHPVRLARALDAVFEMADRELVGLTMLRRPDGGEDLTVVHRALRTVVGDDQATMTVAKAVHGLGDGGIVSVHPGPRAPGEAPGAVSLGFSGGYVLDGGYLSDRGAIDPHQPPRSLVKPRVALVAGPVTHLDQLPPASILERDFSLLLVAPEISPEVAGRLAQWRSLGVRVPHQGQRLRQQLRDLTLITGGRVLDSGDALRTAGRQSLGWLDGEVRSDGAVTVLQGEPASPQRVTDLVERLYGDLPFETDPVRQAWLRERAARLTHQVVLLRVAGTAEAAWSATAARVDKAVRIGHLVVREGVVAGAAHALAVLGERKLSLPGQAEERVVTRALGKALTAPVRVIAANSGGDAERIVRDCCENWPRRSYDARSGSFVGAGRILDPVAVQRSLLFAVRDAAREFLELV